MHLFQLTVPVMFLWAFPPASSALSTWSRLLLSQLTEAFPSLLYSPLIVLAANLLTSWTTLASRDRTGDQLIILFCSVDDVPPQSDPSSSEEGRWGDYARGAVYALQQKGHVLREGIIGIIDGSRGFDCSGVSSSAATGVAFLLALEYANGLHSITEDDNIELDRVIENEYLGLRNGVLDQSAILLSRENRLTLIDCKVSGSLISQFPMEGSMFCPQRGWLLC